MVNLTRASDELYRRSPDECFDSLSDLSRHCQATKEHSRRLREPGVEFSPVANEGQLRLKINGHGAFPLNDWSFTQVCSIAGVNKDTANRLRPKTAAQVLTETLHQRTDEDSDLQALVYDDGDIRAVNGVSYIG